MVRLCLRVGLAAGVLLIGATSAFAQTQIKPRVMLMVDTSGSMAEDTATNTATGGDGSVSYQDQFMTIGPNATTPNMSAYRGYSSVNTCPPALNTTLGSTSKMAAAKQAVTNVINGSGDIDWGLMRYTGASVGFPTAFTGVTAHSINPDPEIWPTANPLPVFCTTDAQCGGTQTCAAGRCTRQNCGATGVQGPCASGRTCTAGTGGINTCSCNNDTDCGGQNQKCATNQCRGMGGAPCTVGTQCVSGACGASGRCTCSNNNQCKSNSCDTNTGACRCNADNQCQNGATCDTSTGECVITSGTAAAACPSGQQLGVTNQCKCTAGSQCTSGSCDTTSGRCLCTANGQCRSNRCDTGIGVCRCNNDNQCWGAALCGGDSRCLPGDPTDCPTSVESANGQCACGAAGPCIRGETCSGGACQCGGNADCGSSSNFGTCNTGTCGTLGAACATENDCQPGEWCVGSVCGYPNTLVSSNSYGMTDTRGGQACGQQGGLRISYAGTCGTGSAAATNGCDTAQSCFVDSTCGGATAFTAGQCALIGAGPARSCTCATGANCPTNYICTSNRCVYNLGCRSVGGNILVDPSAAGYLATQILPYADGVEIFTDAGGGVTTNPELRANGFTPLGGSARSATAWYNGIKNATVGQPLYDPQLACRPYILVLLTDGSDTCDNTNGGSRDAGSVAGVQGFVAATKPGAKVVNRVEIIGLSTTVAADQTRLNNMAIAGASDRTTARFANNESDIEAALADIVASSVLYEQCNGLDDNCNTLVDEGLGVYEECVPASACFASTCDATGRCPCNGTLANQCDAGFACSNPAGAGFCIPTCSVGVGACQRNGVRKCSASCCVNDGLGTCVAVVAGASTGEVCNNIDDNCNGLIDEGGVCATCNPTAETCNGKDDDCVSGIDNGVLLDVGQQCGSNVGTCTFGLTACVVTSGVFPNATDHIVCQGGTGPAAEVCDGLDNNCDGVVDGMNQACFPLLTAYKATHPSSTRNVGVCADGAQACDTIPNGTIGMPHFGACTGEFGPSDEICDGLDNNCDGVVDNAAGTGGTCCTSGKCGIGVCTSGTLQCSGTTIQCIGGVGPSQEICDGFDNDCNGTVDDVPGKGAACTPAGSMCGGHLVCNTVTKTLDCVADMPMPEVCNGIDDDCDGVIDDAPDVITNDIRLNVACDAPVAPANLPPCMAGKTICKNGSVVCDGAVEPQPNVCGQPSRDCQTSGVFNGNCPSGFACFEGTCAAPCGGGEFPCPGGFVCKHDAASNMDYCISDACNKITCAPGEICQLDDAGAASCIDPCASVSCPSGYRCAMGLCVDDTCLTFGCPDGEVCVNQSCKPDPCFNVVCDFDQYCSPDTGTCVKACVGPCPTGEQCVNGECKGDPCEKLKCSAGQACSVTDGVAICVTDTCGGTSCNPGAACCGGACIQDPCQGITCPGQSVCGLTSECNPTCVAPAAELIVGAGGGGFACDVAGGVGARSASTTSAAWLLIAAAAWLLSRRRQRAR